VGTRLNKLMIIFYVNAILLKKSITLFPNKNNFITNNSKKIHIHIMLKTFISNLNHNNEFSWMIQSQMLVLTFDIKKFNLLNLKQGERPNWWNYNGWKSIKVYHTWQKGLHLYCSPFLPYIFIPIKNNESKVVKNLKRTIF